MMLFKNFPNVQLLWNLSTHTTQSLVLVETDSKMVEDEQNYRTATLLKYVFSEVATVTCATVRVMVFNATFNNISVILWRSVLLMEKTATNHGQMLSRNVVSSTPCLSAGLAGKYQWQEFPVVITGKYRPGKYSKF